MRLAIVSSFLNVGVHTMKVCTVARMRHAGCAILVTVELEQV